MTAPAPLLLACSCRNLSHAARLSLEGDVDRQAYLSVVLTPKPFWRRLGDAWRHILGRDCEFVEVAEVVLTPTDVLAIAMWARDSAALLWRPEPDPPPQDVPDLVLVHCTACSKTHAVLAGETPCAPGAWLDPKPIGGGA